MDDVSDVPEVHCANSVSAEVVVSDSDEMMADSEEAPGADVPDPPSEDEPAPEPSEPGTSHLEIWQVLQPYKLVTPNCALCPDRHQWQPTLQPVTVQAASWPVMLQAAQPLCLQPPVTRVKPVGMQLPMAGAGRRVNHIPAHTQHLIAGAAGSPPPPPPPAPPQLMGML